MLFREMDTLAFVDKENHLPVDKEVTLSASSLLDRIKGHQKLFADDAAVARAAGPARRGLAVDRDRDREDALRADVEVAAVVVDSGTDPERAKHRVPRAPPEGLLLRVARLLLLPTCSFSLCP